MRAALVKLRNMITRGVVDSLDAAGHYQVLWTGGRASAGVENKQPQGVHFHAPVDADGVMLAPFGDRSAAVLLGASGPVPSGSIAAGEGGLHYLGEWKVFLAADGTLALSAKAPADWIALASKVDARISGLRSDLTSLKTAIGTGFTAVGVGVAANGPAGKAAFDTAAAAIPAAAASVASTKVKAD
jgi:hypothetical protein